MENKNNNPKLVMNGGFSSEALGLIIVSTKMGTKDILVFVADEVHQSEYMKSLSVTSVNASLDEYT